VLAGRFFVVETGFLVEGFGHGSFLQVMAELSSPDLRMSSI
jgi:hypothetical protein